MDSRGEGHARRAASVPRAGGHAERLLRLDASAAEPAGAGLAGRIEVYRNPVRGKYAKVTSASRDHTLTPLEVPSATLSVDRILG